MTGSVPLTVWEGKLSFLLSEQAKAVDPEAKFALIKAIAEAEAMLEELKEPPFPVPFANRSAPTRLTHIAEELFGREAELARLDAAWDDPAIHVVTIVAWGGVGKTSLVAKWAAGKALSGVNCFDWSFYSQGTKEEGSASGEPFVSAALRFFGDGEGERIANSSVSA